MNERQEDCYIWMDESIPEEERTMSVLCEQCHLTYPNLGWFWEGSRLGYGKFEYACDKCGHIIHSQRNELQNQDES